MKFIILVVICVTFTFSLSAQSLGAKLALVDTEKHYSETDPLTKRYNNILNQLAEKYIESKERIADITVVGKREL